MGTIDLKQVKKITGILSGKNAEAPDESGPFLFYYSTFTFIQDDRYITLTETQAEDKLKQYPDTSIYYCRLQGSPDSPPSILVGKKLQKEIVEGHEALSDLIHSITGVRVPPEALMIPQSNKVKDARPIGVRTTEFLNQIKKNTK